MHAHLLWRCDHVAELRLFDRDSAFGEAPFVWACNVVRVGSTALLSMAPGRPPPPGGDAIRETLRREGFKRMGWERCRGGKLQRTKDYPL